MQIVNLKFKIKNRPGPIAQLGARLNGIEKVGGSNPPGSTQRKADWQSALLKVRTGVVGHPVSEKGKRGESPSTASNGNAIETELACFLERETSQVNATMLRVASDGEAR